MSSNHWLYQLILAEDSDRAPQEAQQSTLNWAAALASEVAVEHGASPREHFRSCLARFRESTQGGGDLAAGGMAGVFEPLWSSLTYAMSVSSRALDEASGPWCIPGTIVEWYYAHYMAVRSMLAAAPMDVDDTHASVLKAYGGSLRRKMPHPYDMVSRWVRNQEFSKELPAFPGVRGMDLSGSFPGSRGGVQSVLVGYLSGTTDREVEVIKERLKQQHSLDDFRSKTAREIRDRAIEKKEYNFMHCAFRYRGKANYRDAIYLTYGNRPLVGHRKFVADLAMASRFICVCALAFARVRMGPAVTRLFLEDLLRNLRGRESARSGEVLWEGILEEIG